MLIHTGESNFFRYYKRLEEFAKLATSYCLKMNELDALMLETGSDKASSDHDYCRIYEPLFREFSTGHFCKSFCNRWLRGCPIVYAFWRAPPIQKEQAMSDNLRQYRAIREALTQAYPGQPTGRLVRHLTTLAAFISGIVASKSTQLPKVAA